MKVREALFVTSARNPSQYPRKDLPEVAFAGRSNVGKSSLINTLLHRRGLAKTSATPGKTRLLNFFVVNSVLSFVDLPGYGFAKVPERIRRSWESTVEAYLRGRNELRLVIVLLDARRDPGGHDLQLITWLRHYEISFAVVVTKIDKVPKSRRTSRIREIASRLEEHGETIIPFSAASGEGKEAVWQVIMRAAFTSENTRS
jgi:GTP-binding protein